MIEGLSVYGSGTSSTTTTSSAEETMGKDAFLQLLVTQLENQDPLNPTENTEFVAQLAQFSSLEGIQNLNTSLEDVVGSIDAMQAFSSASLIGRNATAESSSFNYEGTPEKLGFSIENDAASATLVVKDSSGNTVKEMSLGQVEAGYHEVEWDGVNSDGLAAEQGLYTFSIDAKDSDSQSIDAKEFINGQVTGVSFGDSSALLIDGIEITSDMVQAIY